MEITFEEYSNAIHLAKYVKDKSQSERYTELTLGLYEEVAEVTSPIRRTIKGNYHEKEMDLSHLSEEMGDVLWYIVQIGKQLPSTRFEEIVARNIEKTSGSPKVALVHDKNIGIKEYEDHVSGTYQENLPKSKEERARFLCMGLIKEVGEISHLFGRHRINGDELAIPKVKENLGDSLWYLAALCDNYGLNLGDIAKENLDKVHGRYNQDGTVIEER